MQVRTLPTQLSGAGAPPPASSADGPADSTPSGARSRLPGHSRSTRAETVCNGHERSSGAQVNGHMTPPVMLEVDEVRSSIPAAEVASLAGSHPKACRKVPGAPDPAIGLGPTCAPSRSRRVRAIASPRRRAHSSTFPLPAQPRRGRRPRLLDQDPQPPIGHAIGAFGTPASCGRADHGRATAAGPATWTVNAHGDPQARASCVSPGGRASPRPAQGLTVNRNSPVMSKLGNRSGSV
jgi:hypothetical protein